MSCGPTMQVAMIKPASLPARFVTAAAAIGNIAALARWNKTAQTAKAINLRSVKTCQDRARGCNDARGKGVGGGRSGAEGASRKLASAANAGIASVAANRNTARSPRE